MRVAAVVFSLAASLTAPAAEQSTYEIPRVVRIQREEIRPGRRAEHERQQVALVHAYDRAKFRMYYIAMSSVSGPHEFWSVEHYASFAGIEETDRMLTDAPALHNEITAIETADADFRLTGQTWLGMFRQDLSYRTDALTTNMSKYRYMTVGTIHVRPGHDRDFAELARMLNANYTRARDERPYLIYQIVSGTSTGTYLVFAPLVSLESYDEAPDRSRALRDVIGEENMREVNRRTAEYITMTESALFQLRPDLSYRMTVSSAAR